MFKRIFKGYFKVNLLVKITVGLVLGVIFGAILGKHILWVQPFGDLFVNLLKMVVVPIVFASLVVGASSINPKQMGKIGIKIFIYYMITSAAAVALGLLMGNLFAPGKGMQLNAGGEATLSNALNTPPPSFSETLLNIVPSNPFEAISSGNVLQIIFFALLLGIAISILKSSEDVSKQELGKLFSQFFTAIAEATFIIVGWIMQYAPIGVFALIAVVIAKGGTQSLEQIGILILATFVGYVLQVVLVYSGLVRLFRLSPIRFFKGIRSAMLTAFVTRSSSGTLPVSMEDCEENLGVEGDVYSFSLPLGATINMDGTAIYLGVCVIFLANAVGSPLTFGQQMTVILTAVLASIGTAGVPSAGLFMLAMVMKAVGLPLEAGTAVAAAYAMVAGADSILDMGRSWVNVTGDIAGTCIVAKTEKQLDLSKWK